MGSLCVLGGACAGGGYIVYKREENKTLNKNKSFLSDRTKDNSGEKYKSFSKLKEGEGIQELEEHFPSLPVDFENDAEETLKLQEKQKNVEWRLFFYLEDGKWSSSKYYSDVSKVVLLSNDEYEKQKANHELQSDSGEIYGLKEFFALEITQPIKQKEAKTFLEKLNSNTKKENFHKRLKRKEDKFKKMFGEDLYKELVGKINLKK